MKNILATLTLALVATIVTSCKKSEEVTCIAGNNGNVSVKIIPTIDGAAVTSTAGNPVKVYIAFNTTSMPGTAENNYQRTVKAKSNETSVACGNLKCGIYYFYVTQVDEGTGDTYSGGVQFVTDNPDGAFDLSISLTLQ